MIKLNKTEWDKIKTMEDGQIDYSDIPETDADFWNDAQLVLPEQKASIEFEIDQDIAKWIQNFEDSNFVVNKILRSYYSNIGELKSS